jgi:hypothetical protein
VRKDERNVFLLGGDSGVWCVRTGSGVRGGAGVIRSTSRSMGDDGAAKVSGVGARRCELICAKDT